MTTDHEMKAGERYGAQLAVRELTVATWNARRAVETDEVKELAASIQQDGLLQPLVVRVVTGQSETLGAGIVGKWQVICGARRLAAVRLLGWETVQCWVVDESDARAKVMNLTENIQRRSLAPLDEAEAFAALIETEGMTVQMVAAEIGKGTDPSYVAQRVRLCRLIPKFKEALAKGRIGVGVALLAARIMDEHQRELAALILRAGESAESYGVQFVKDWVARHHMRDLKEAPWAMRDEAYRGEALSGGACEACPKQTGRNEFLFPELMKGKVIAVRCLDSTCWKARVAQIIRIETMADESLVQLDGRESWTYHVLPSGTKRGIFVTDGYDGGNIVAGTCVQFEFATSGGDDAGASEAKAKREAKKARTMRAIRLKVLQATVTVILGAGAHRLDIEPTIKTVVSRMVNDDRRFLCQALGLEVAARQFGGKDFEATLLQWVRGLKLETTGAAFNLVVALAVACHGSRADADGDVLMDAAARQKVDVAGIEAGMQEGKKKAATPAQKGVHERNTKTHANKLVAGPAFDAMKKKRKRTPFEETKTGKRVTHKLKVRAAGKAK